MLVYCRVEVSCFQSLSETDGFFLYHDTTNDTTLCVVFSACPFKVSNLFFSNFNLHFE